MQYNRNIVRVKQLLQCDANSRDSEQSMNCIFYPDSGSVRTGQMNGIQKYTLRTVLAVKS